MSGRAGGARDEPGAAAGPTRSLGPALSVPVLAVNAGSSTLKLSVVAPDGTVTGERVIDPWDGSAEGVRFDDLPPPSAVGHRVVHGGSRYTRATPINDAVLAGIEDLAAFAPLHQPRALAAIAAARRAFPQLPHVACFDTAFHATMPPEAATYALPAAWRARFGLRKFGFHGLSHGYAARRAAQILGRTGRFVTAHLGAGSSLAAVLDGRCVETTMGFTPLDGLVMATRCGSVDPGLLLWLAGRLPIGELSDGLEHRSGLAGLADLIGGSGDMRDVAAAAGRGDPRAKLAVDVHAHRLTADIAAMAAAMNGLDALVFTGGIGEHQPAVRARAAAGLGFLGIALDQESNAAAHADADITADGAVVRTLVVTAREDDEIARQVNTVLA